MYKRQVSSVSVGETSSVIGFRDEQNGKLNTHFDPSKKLPDEGIILVVADNRTLEKFDYLGYLK